MSHLQAFDASEQYHVQLQSKLSPDLQLSVSREHGLSVKIESSFEAIL